MIREHQDDPRAARHLLRRLALARDLLQLRLLGRRRVNAARLNRHAPPVPGQRGEVQCFILHPELVLTRLVRSP